jgi:glycosyltransferase involved in cell wall biosynthesis
VGVPLGSISVVVPVYNERESVGPLMAELLPVMRELGREFEVIFVDDGSRDGTAEALAELVAEEPEIATVRLRRNFGKAEALMAGFRVANGDAVVTIDGDLQDDPAESRNLYPQGLPMAARLDSVLARWIAPKGLHPARIPTAEESGRWRILKSLGYVE